MIPEAVKRPLRGTALYNLLRSARNRLDDLRPLTDSEAINARYDRQTLEVMRRVLRPDSLCVDVGAHGGVILAQMFELAPRAQHFAIEPLPHLASDLRARFPRARVLEHAVSDRSGVSTFVHVENDPGYSGLRQRVYARPDAITREIIVRVTSLDDLIRDDERVAFIKIDIEGGEYHALKGAVQTIRECRPVVVFEAAKESTGQYGVTPRDMFYLITDTLGYDLSTMARWLRGAPPFTVDTYSWDRDFYFIATPRL